MIKMNLDHELDQDPMQLIDEVPSSRVGDKIRKIRLEKGLSQAELGNLVELPAGRIQKYESGERKPRPDLLKKIASALGVSPFAIEDPVLTSYTGTMFALFDLIDDFDLSIKESEVDNSMSIIVDSSSDLYYLMKKWYDIYFYHEVATMFGTDKENIEELKAYHDRLWNSPRGIPRRNNSEKEQIQRKIEMLQESIKELKKKLNQ